MTRLSAATRMTVGLACLATSVLLVAQALGLVPTRHNAQQQERRELCDAIASEATTFNKPDALPQLRAALEGILARNPQIARIELENSVGEDALRIENPDLADAPNRQTWTESQAIYAEDDGGWGVANVQFQAPAGYGWLGILDEPTVQLALFTAVTSFAVYFFYLRRMLDHLDPAQVVPDRVRSALDTLAEGLLVIDREGRIVMANEAFARTLGKTTDQLKGRLANDLPWAKQEGEAAVEFPWVRVIRDGKPQTGVVLALRVGSGGERKLFRVNSSPIQSEDGQYRGALTSFDDVTLVERNRAELREMLHVLEESRDEITRQNEELQILATLDPLTSCMNRRSFFNRFETIWESARQRDDLIGCIMLDVDNFKQINDDLGHGVGDQVLRKMGEILRQGRREGDLVCRYGGEEFCLLLPSADLDYVAHVAEQIRLAISQTPIDGLAITISLGVSVNQLGATDTHDLLNQADKALYFAKRNGRNRVVRYDEVPADVVDEEAKPSSSRPWRPAEIPTAIPFHAVTALVSALAYRDSATAEHSRRVADLCVASASGLLTGSDTYVLEIAALLHDIGKIGVPDAVLLKPGPLDQEEWKLMSVHDRIGVEIIRSTFACKKLSRIVQTHHAWYGEGESATELPHGDKIQLAARILTIADAYDAMVTDRVYRKGRTQDEAFDELRRCAGKQFDAELVERFIQTVQARDSNRGLPLPSVSKQVALRIGLEIEQLTAALDEQDLFSLQVLAGRLKATAAKHGIAPIAEVASLLEHAAANEPDVMEVVQLTTELLELCRSTQRVYLGGAVSMSSSDPTPTP